MTPEPFDVLFLPERRRYTAAGPTALYMAAAGAGLIVEQPCGSQGACGRCRVRIAEGRVPASSADHDHLEPSELAAGWRLACQVVLEGPTTIEVPALTRWLAGKSFGDELLVEPGSAIVEAACVSLPSPGTVPIPALERLAAALGRPARSLRAAPRALADLLAAIGVSRRAFVVLEGDELIAAAAGGTRAVFGLAIDIGTTSLAAGLVALGDGAVVSSVSTLNPQVAFGADVIARIQHALEDPGGLRHLTAAVREGLGQLARQLVAEAGCRPEDIVAATVAGNPTMLHTWAGIPVGSLGIAPYAGAWSREMSCRASEVDLPIHPNAPVYVFPQVRSHVGGDAVADAIACDADRAKGCRLLIDLGTNSEVVAVGHGRIVATSASAGPAFEGVSIREGMRAAPGAIDLVSFAADGRVVVHTVGDAPAAGICGSGLIDLVAEMVRVGLVAPSGYLRRREEVASLPRALTDRLLEVDRQQAFRILARGESGAERDIVLTARDIREVQLAKGSIMAAATLACRHLGVEVEQLDEVLVAGAFGSFIRKASARGIGLLPRIDPQRVRLVGNAAGVGARLALLDREVRERARRFGERAEYVELATRGDYQATFLEMLPFPEVGAFP